MRALFTLLAAAIVLFSRCDAIPVSSNDARNADDVEMQQLPYRSLRGEDSKAQLLGGDDTYGASKEALETSEKRRLAVSGDPLLVKIFCKLFPHVKRLPQHGTHVYPMPPIRTKTLPNKEKLVTPRVFGS
ncbi:hypothetical protein GN244_ATG18170 [Phytophthora infestans]|uniref:Secreted RxLR effector peptide protein n=1 Tax=Phytophthora infestans TaxID=4787 RepID=A0A833W625_PHYIN|nr:hypothetical protein GN244_ATG18170 [Phytophthora infestans]KAF4136319.1 hypothetical protein GN958_ATG14491 [Phytophthora infestans]